MKTSDQLYEELVTKVGGRLQERGAELRSRQVDEALRAMAEELARLERKIESAGRP